jgi:hypothetical protein
MYSKAILDREVKEEILDVNESLDKQATTPEAQAADIKIHEALANFSPIGSRVRLHELKLCARGPFLIKRGIFEQTVQNKS